MTVKAVIEKLVNDPSAYWQENTRQAEKLSKRIAKAKTRFDFTNAELVFDVMKLAEERIQNNSKTIFLSSIGSSGSHLFQACISRAWESIPLGEVYLPPQLIEDVKDFNIAELNLLSESYLLLHDYEFKHRYNTDAFIINTLHHPKLSKFSLWSKNYSSAVIHRDPVQIVISRTFRKDEYRAYQNKDGVTDKEYLDINISKVNAFYANASNFNHSVKLSFEELCAISDSEIQALQALVGVPVSSELSVAEIVRSTLSEGDKTNRFEGERKNLSSDIADYIKSKIVF